LNRLYLQESAIETSSFLAEEWRGLDTGTHESLLTGLKLHPYHRAERQGLKIACLEEIAYNKGFIDREKLLELAEN
jgi:glucose-1-phosphate thymidylyltransferase